MIVPFHNSTLNPHSYFYPQTLPSHNPPTSYLNRLPNPLTSTPKTPNTRPLPLPAPEVCKKLAPVGELTATVVGPVITTSVTPPTTVDFPFKNVVVPPTTVVLPWIARSGLIGTVVGPVKTSNALPEMSVMLPGRAAIVV